MESTVEPLEGNKVKLSVEVDSVVFEQEVDAAFKRIAREVRVPGFRPGKAPRKLLEARIGLEAAKGDAIEHIVPKYYFQAVLQHEVDVIAAPEYDVTTKIEDDHVAFDAVVEVRPTVNPSGYESLRVTVDSPEVSDTDIEEQVDRLRESFAQLQTVERAVAAEDHVLVDIVGSRDGESLGGLEADDYLYEVGSATIVPELDEQLTGSNVGDVLEFVADHPLEGELPIDFVVTVKEVREKVVPDADDAFALEASEFESIDELRADLREKMGPVKRYRVTMQMRNNTADALAELVTEDAPDSLVEAEIQRRLEDLSQRLIDQGINPQEYLQSTEGGPEAFFAEIRAAAHRAVKVDLALRAVAASEELDVTDEEVEAQFGVIAERSNAKVAQVRKEFERNGQVPALRSEMRNHRALEWLIERVELVDEGGNPIDRSALEIAPETDDEALTEDTE